MRTDSMGLRLKNVFRELGGHTLLDYAKARFRHTDIDSFAVAPAHGTCMGTMH